MKSFLHHLGWSSLACLAITGCESSPPPPAPSAPTPEPAATTPGEKKENDIKAMPVEPAKGASTTEPAKLSDEEMAEIKKLPADEQPVAMAQMVCPVSGKNLGSMDKPLKQTIDGKDFYICCSGCEDKVKEEPAKVLANLKK